MNSIAVRCETCLFREGASCKPYPPSSGHDAARWPFVSPDDRCGEWNPSNAALDEYFKRNHRHPIAASILRDGWG